MAHLRLDLYINSKEILVGEADVTVCGFNSLTGNDYVMFQSSVDEIETKGFSHLTAEQMQDGDVKELVREYTNREIRDTDEIYYVMCLWEGDEHVKSQIKLSEVE